MSDVGRSPFLIDHSSLCLSFTQLLLSGLRQRDNFFTFNRAGAVEFVRTLIALDEQQVAAFVFAIRVRITVFAALMAYADNFF